MPTVVLLGPQRLKPNLIEVVRSLDVRGRISTITAGWEERETEDEELRAHLEGRAVNLQLWERTERLFQVDPELLAGLRTRKERLARVHALYNVRLNHAMAALSELLRRQEPAEILEPEVAAALDAVRELDAHHLDRTGEIYAEFDDRYRPAEREHLAVQRRQVARIIEDSDALCIAGGHVGVLLTRLRLFDVLPLVGMRPIIAWSAGAMALGTRVVLFHHDPPQGFGHAQIYAPGLGAYRRLIPFPHARRRLHLTDRERVMVLAQRFAPDACVPLDEGDRVDWRGTYLVPASGTRTLEPTGTVARSGAA